MYSIYTSVYTIHKVFCIHKKVEVDILSDMTLLCCAKDE